MFMKYIFHIHYEHIFHIYYEYIYVYHEGLMLSEKSEAKI